MGARVRGRMIKAHMIAHICNRFSESLLIEEDATQVRLEDTLEDDFDIEAELERKELIELLNRAFALLTPEARTLLIARYIEETPLAEVAAQLGMNTGAVTMRLQRGKIALLRVLTTELRHELAPHIGWVQPMNLVGKRPLSGVCPAASAASSGDTTNMSMSYGSNARSAVPSRIIFMFILTRPLS